MTPAVNRFRRRARRGEGGEVRLGRMLAISLAIHGLVVLVTVVTWRPALLHPPTETYRVELVSLPVASPQRGRSTPVAAEAAVERPAPPTKPAAVKVPSLPNPRKDAPQVAVKKAPTKSPAKKTPAPDRAYDDAQDAIERMELKQEREELKKKLAKLAKVDPRAGTSTPEVPPGNDAGKGKDPGSTYEAYIRQELKSNWTLNKYQVVNLNLSAEVNLTFDARGTLTDYRFLRPSGEARFDESVKRAILDLRPLPTAPGKTFTLKVIFNLKELLER